MIMLYKNFKMMLSGGGLFLIAFFFLGCGDDASEWQRMESVAVRHNLISFTDADAYLSYVKDAANQRMQAEVEINRAREIAWLTDDSRNWDDAGGDQVMVNDASDAAPESTKSSDGDTASYSSTNVQEAGVDEADIVKTDGEYIYALGNGSFVVVSASDGVMTKSGTVSVDGYPIEMFVLNDVVVVFSNRAEADVPESMHYPMRDAENPWNMKYDDRPADNEVPDMDMPKDSYCDSYGCSGNTYLQMTLINMSDRATPTVSREVIYGGQYVTSRMVDGMVRLVLESPMHMLETDWDYGEAPSWETEEEINTAYANVLSVNQQAFAQLTLNDVLPRKWDSMTNEVSSITNPADITAPQTPNGVGLQTIVSVDLNNPLTDSMQAGVFSQRGIVYASTDSLYLTSARDWVSLAMESGLWSGYENQTTGIHKFDISSDSPAVTWEASGTVDGRLLNQFSIGEKDGYLRVATTTGEFWWGDEQNTLDNHVFVLGQSGHALQQVGHVGGLGEGEEIYAVRFLADKAFVVTFFQMDPLYTIDLSDPANPTKLGEWEGPGYSTYLHPFGDNLLLAMGQEDFQTTVSLYNIADFFNPILVERIFMATDDWSAALYDHKAFTFNPETGYLSIPYNSWDTDFETGIKTYNVTEAGIDEGESLILASGLNNSESYAERSLYIGAHLYGMSRCRIASAPLDAPAGIVSSITLFEGDVCNDSPYLYY